MYEQATILMMQGELQSAREQFIAIIKQDPTHLGALINFAVLLADTGYNSAAKTAYLQALAHYPTELLAHVNIANLYFQERLFKEAQSHYEQVLALVAAMPEQLKMDPSIIAHLAHAHQGLALIYFEDGDQTKADIHHANGFCLEPLREFSYPLINSTKSILVLIGGRGGDIPWPTIVDQKYFTVDTLAVDYWSKVRQDLKSNKRYDLILNAIGDADSSKPSLLAAHRFLQLISNSEQSALFSAPQPSSCAALSILNTPEAVLLTGRKTNSDRFKNLPFVKTPASIFVARSALEGVDSIIKVLNSKVSFPVVVRSLGFQTGKHFEFADSPEELERVARGLPGEELLVMEFLNCRDERGFFRKYRIMFINGEMYPLHLALSEHWKVHYFSAAMKNSSENRAQEQFFLENMHEALGDSAIKALVAVQQTLALDYAGVDFALSPNGEVLVFEANATMIMALAPGDEIWNYRKKHIQVAKEAVQRMLIERANLNMPAFSLPI